MGANTSQDDNMTRESHERDDAQKAPLKDLAYYQSRFKDFERLSPEQLAERFPNTRSGTDKLRDLCMEHMIRSEGLSIEAAYERLTKDDEKSTSVDRYFQEKRSSRER
jgi:hypothetical protein